MPHLPPHQHHPPHQPPLPPPSSSHHPPPPTSQPPHHTRRSSRPVVSFDFTPPPSSTTPPFNISITEQNLSLFQSLVTQTSLSTLPPASVCDIILRYCNYDGLLHRDDYGQFIRELIPKERSRNIESGRLRTFSQFFNNLFTCFDHRQDHSVVGRELAIGFSFLCRGNKSAKLSVGFELLDLRREGVLQPGELIKFLRSYLTMLVGISFLSPRDEGEDDDHPVKPYIYPALNNGARWTQDHMMQHLRKHHRRTDVVSFESFATWYTEGGYTVAPWLELLDLNKFLTLLTDVAGASGGGGSFDDHRSSRSGRNSNNSNPIAPPTNTTTTSNTSNPPHNPPLPVKDAEILFTFPLANDQRLVVQREDALYVRTVVNQLGLLVLEPEDVWAQLLRDTRGSTLPYPRDRNQQPNNPGTNNNGIPGRGGLVDQRTFVRAMEGIVARCTNNRVVNRDARSIMVNFYQSFDLEQIDRVPMNQLMGGLTLLCGGRKSSKLAFAFGLFDDAPKQKKDENDVSLNDQELFLFLRSYLIVLFSCCAQSLDLSADCVGTFIGDTSHMVRHDVMRHQWYQRGVDHVSFDEFGEWYNEGGFETAPWLELLDLNKWVLLDKFNNEIPPPHTQSSSSTEQQRDFPQPPPSMMMDTDDNNNSTSNVRSSHPPPSSSSSTYPPAGPTSSKPPPSSEDNFFPDQMDWTQDGDIFNNTSYPTNNQRQQSPYRSSYNNHNPHHHHPQHSSHPPPPPRSPPHPHPKQPPSVSTSRSNTTNNNPPNNPTNPSHPTQPPPDPLKFHLLTNDDHGGYLISILPHHLSHLRKLVVDSGLSQKDTCSVCNRLLDHAERRGPPGGPHGKNPGSTVNSENDNAHQANDAHVRSQRMILTKDGFDRAIRHIIGKSASVERMGLDSQRKLSDLLTNIFASFDRDKCMSVDALEFACGFSILCGGRKSDKLEYAFDLLDDDKDGNLTRRGMFRYLRSFLTVLMSLSGSDNVSLMNSQNGGSNGSGGGSNGRDKNFRVVIPAAVDAGSAWATDQVFNAGDNGGGGGGGGGWKQVISFDDFAEWYTRGGYGSIPWLELLDLRKWVLA